MYEVQAIVARTYAVAHRGRHARDGFDLCATTPLPALRAGPPGHLALVRRGADAAAGETAGMLLLYDGLPADVVFHADCGGSTSAAADVWGGDRPPVPARAGGRWRRPVRAHASWQYAVDAETLRARARRQPAARGSARRSTHRRVVARDASGRVARLRLAAASGARYVTIPGTALRDAMSAAFGARSLRSTLFDVVRSGRQFVFSGKGFGHGVGLCQVGALARVTAGRGRAHGARALLPGHRRRSPHRSRGHRIHHQIDRELGVVLALEALVPPVVVPLAAVVLVAVEHAQPAAALDPAQVVVDDVVSPPVQLVRGRRRTAVEDWKKLR